MWRHSVVLADHANTSTPNPSKCWPFDWFRQHTDQQTDQKNDQEKKTTDKCSVSFRFYSLRKTDLISKTGRSCLRWKQENRPRPLPFLVHNTGVPPISHHYTVSFLHYLSTLTCYYIGFLVLIRGPDKGQRRALARPPTPILRGYHVGWPLSKKHPGFRLRYRYFGRWVDDHPAACCRLLTVWHTKNILLRHFL